MKQANSPKGPWLFKTEHFSREQQPARRLRYERALGVRCIVSSSGAKVPNSRIFRERAEDYRALANSFRSEEMRALLLNVAADYDRMADQGATFEIEDADHAA
jgi:hypothetical protein